MVGDDFPAVAVEHEIGRHAHDGEADLVDDRLRIVGDTDVLPNALSGE